MKLKTNTWYVRNISWHCSWLRMSQSVWFCGVCCLCLYILLLCMLMLLTHRYEIVRGTGIICIPIDYLQQRDSAFTENFNLDGWMIVINEAIRMSFQRSPAITVVEIFLKYSLNRLRRNDDFICSCQYLKDIECDGKLKISRIKKYRNLHNLKKVKHVENFFLLATYSIER